MSIVATLINLYIAILVISVIASWLPIGADHPAMRALNAVTEPVLAPIRRILPDMGGIDLSPMVVLVVLYWIQSLIV